MTFIEVFTDAQQLSREDQIRLIDELSTKLKNPEKESVQIETGNTYEIWSPHDSYEAADELLKLLEESKKDTLP